MKPPNKKRTRKITGFILLDRNGEITKEFGNKNITVLESKPEPTHEKAFELFGLRIVEVEIIIKLNK